MRAAIAAAFAAVIVLAIAIPDAVRQLGYILHPTYEFEAEFIITRAAGATSHTTALLFGGTATLTSLRYFADVSNPNGNALAAVQLIYGECLVGSVVVSFDADIEDIGIYQSQDAWGSLSLADGLATEFGAPPS